jgi:integrase
MPKLTELTVKNAKAGAARREIPDAVCPGLYLVVQPSGAKSWTTRYRYAGKPRKLTHGPVSDALGLVEARELSRAATRAVAAGRDPGAEKIEARRKAADEAARIEQGEVLKATDPFEVVWDAFDREHIGPSLRPSTAESWRRVYTKTFKPRWAKRPLNAITPADIHGVLKALQKTPDAADTALKVAKAFFNWTMAAPRHLLAVSPCTGIAKVKRDKESDDRTLTDDEIRWAWKASEKVGYPFGGLVQLLLLTGTRRNEAAQLVEPELDFAARLWRLPGSRAKNGRAHAIHLSGPTIAVLKSLPEMKSDSGFIFTTNGKTPISGFSKMKLALDKAMAEVAAEERGEPVKIPAWHLHSLRKTFATGLARLGIALQVAERCINHVSGTLGGLAGIYNKHEYQAEQVIAFDAWARHVETVVSGKAANVLPMVRQREAV